jgi:dTDP-glucose 4,6-dehydratase
MFDWNKKSVLVTGGTGFIGSWLTEFLLKSVADVTILVKPDDPLGFGGISHLLERVRIVFGDLRDSKKVEEAIKNQEIIFHLGAQTQVLNSINNPKESVEVNVGGTLNVLEAARKNESTKFLVYSSTDKVYGEPKYLPIDENHPLSAVSPYDAGKASGDLLFTSYQTTYGLPSSTTRWSNTIGGRDANLLRAAPDFITSIIHGKPPTIRGSGKHVRDYLYVEDAVNGIVKVAENESVSNGQVYNLGTENPTSVIDIANMIIDQMGYTGKIKSVILNNETKGEITEQYLSSKRARKELHWSPAYSLKKSIEKTIDWYVHNPKWYQIMQKVASQQQVSKIT